MLSVPVRARIFPWPRGGNSYVGKLVRTSASIDFISKHLMNRDKQRVGRLAWNLFKQSSVQRLERAAFDLAFSD